MRSLCSAIFAAWKRNRILLALPPLLAAGLTPARSQDAQSKSPVDQTNEPPVKSLSDVRRGVSRAQVLTGLAADYTLTKWPDIDPNLEVWSVVAKVRPFESAQVNFVGGKTYSVKASLLTTESPDVVKFVDTLQSALYNSATPPTSAEADAMQRSMASNAGVKLSNEQLVAGEQLQMKFWQMNNQRFGIAQVGASQFHNPIGDERTISITIDGRSFEISLISIPGAQTVIYFSEFKQ
jgi:hypothetical protein